MKSSSALFAALLLLAVGCASSSPVDDSDASVGGPDASTQPDALTGDGFGTECEDNSDCASGICYHANGAEEPGFCSQDCEGNCPDGFACKVVMVADFTDRRICVPAEDNFCDQCAANQDCGDTSDFCVELTGGFFCTKDCAGNPSICPVGFTCQTVAGTGDTVVGMQCMPINGICCVDADSDLRGDGAGCVTTDCDDDNPAVYDDAAEVCDTFDNDCIGGIDVDPTDCATAACSLGALGYFERAAEPCESGDCTAQNANLCGLYTCDQGGELGDACATACDLEDDGKCIPSAHCDASTCYDDLVNGLGSDEDSDCQSNHSQNGFCCPAGDCCSVAEDCPTFGTVAPICDTPATCQGSRGEAICTGNFTCASTGMVQDDSACDSNTLANDCGWYLDRYCTGSANQAPPTCATSCSTDAQCDAGAYCKTGVCVQDEPDGGVCNNTDSQGAAECQSAHCQNGFCCDGGDCCQTEANCPGSYTSPPVCTTPTTCQGEADVAQCTNNQCSTSVGVDDDSACTSGVLASNCGAWLPINCDGNSVQNPPMCPTTCTSDSQCDANAYCSPGGVCVPDQPDGGICNNGDGQGNAECQAGHCQNGYCCASGDCCATAGDCDAYDVGSACGTTATCTGTRVDGVCTGTKQCVAQSVDDDSGCAGLTASDCGPYPSVQCTAGQSQSTPACAMSCVTDNDCDVSAHCDMGQCVPDAGQGGFCDEASDCGSGLFCVDDVCCNSSCTGGCRACDLPGTEGTCTNVGDDQDPDNECGVINCAGYYAGWSGDTCNRRADVPANEASCNGAGACRTAAQECPSSGVGAAATTCNALCQDPNNGTCTGTTAGTCNNVSQGSTTCGAGVCQVSSPVCLNGAPNTCVPNSGAATTETCNNIDDDCVSGIDNGNFSDSYEPNGSCSNVRTITTVNSNATVTHNTMTVHGSGDNDYYRIPAVENDGSCECCDWVCLDEDYQLHIDLTVPSGAGGYWFCTGTDCDGMNATAPESNPNCQQVLAGQTRRWTWTMDGACGPGQTDSYNRYVRILGGNSPGYECLPYTLKYNLVTGCF